MECVRGAWGRDVQALQSSFLDAHSKAIDVPVVKIFMAAWIICVSTIHGYTNLWKCISMLREFVALHVQYYAPGMFFFVQVLVKWVF